METDRHMYKIHQPLAQPPPLDCVQMSFDASRPRLCSHLVCTRCVSQVALLHSLRILVFSSSYCLQHNRSQQAIIAMWSAVMGQNIQGCGLDELPTHSSYLSLHRDVHPFASRFARALPSPGFAAISASILSWRRRRASIRARVAGFGLSSLSGVGLADPSWIAW
jgi:hypothetical protein